MTATTTAAAPRKITKTAARNLARRVGAQIWSPNPTLRYRTTIGTHARPDFTWVTREIFKKHKALLAEIAKYGIIGNAGRDFRIGRGFHRGAKPVVADLSDAKKAGDLQTVADILAWWSLRMAPAVEMLQY